MTKRRVGYVVGGVAVGLLVTTGIVLLLNTLRGTGRPAELAAASRSPADVALVTPPASTASPSTGLLNSSPTAALPRPVTSSSSAPTSSAAAPASSTIGQESVPIIYDQSGVGNAVTKDFQVPSQWLIYWSYACSPSGSPAGEFSVTIYLKGVDAPLKTFSNNAGSTSGVEHNFVGDGWYHLAMASSCPWRVTVTPAPGFSVSPSPSR